MYVLFNVTGIFCILKIPDVLNRMTLIRFAFIIQQKDESKKVPTEDIINKLTSTLPKPQPAKTQEQPTVTVDVSQIIISLAFCVEV